jgi:hypothetical protein
MFAFYRTASGSEGLRFRYSLRLSKISRPRTRYRSMTILQCSRHSSILPNMTARDVHLFGDQCCALQAATGAAPQNLVPRDPPRGSRRVPAYMMLARS